MTLTSLQTVTWGTVTGAVLSALLLAASETGLPDLNRLRRGETAVRPALPAEPTGSAMQSKSIAPQGSTVVVEQRALSGR
jgi:hypothetical protein